MGHGLPPPRTRRPIESREATLRGRFVRGTRERTEDREPRTRGNRPKSGMASPPESPQQRAKPAIDPSPMRGRVWGGLLPPRIVLEERLDGLKEVEAGSNLADSSAADLDPSERDRSRAIRHAPRFAPPNSRTGMIPAVLVVYSNPHGVIDSFRGEPHSPATSHSSGGWRNSGAGSFRLVRASAVAGGAAFCAAFFPGVARSKCPSVT